MTDFEQIAAGRAPVDNFEQAKLARAAVECTETMRYSSSLESLRFESLKQYSVRQRGQQPLDLSKDYPIPLNGVNNSSKGYY